MAERKTRYALFPGHVRSKTDGDIHYVGPRQLAQLYGVSPFECITYWNSFDNVLSRFFLDMVKREGLIKLYPDPSGNYKLPQGEPSHG
jgi:hypothetical protein